MSGIYWDQFMATGSVADYLSYKAEQETMEDQVLPDRDGGRKEQSESDRTDGHGALHDASRGI